MSIKRDLLKRVISGYPECNLDDETMLGWFAGAMMAMHDHIYQTSPPTREPLSDEEIYNRCCAMDSSYTCNFIDGVEWAEKAHGIGGGNE